MLLHHLRQVYADINRDGYAHTLIQALNGTNAALFDVAKFLVGFADDEFAHRPVVAVTAYMYTTAGSYPGGPWLVFSQAALPLRGLIAQIAEDLFIDKDRTKADEVPRGKIA
eukprot:7379572-Prymnesium_polylepis.2